jgi:hypothetical protein
MKLISMTEKVCEVWEYAGLTDTEKLNALARHANFLKQPLKLEMFVPCDEEGNILEEPLAYNFKSVELFTNYNIKYQKAKEKVLFEEFELKEELEFVYKFKYKGKGEFNVLKHDLPIEWLVGDEIELTPNAIKQLGL